MSKVININPGDDVEFNRVGDYTATIKYGGITSTFDSNGVVLSSDGDYFTITTSGAVVMDEAEAEKEKAAPPEPEPQVAPPEPEPQVEYEAAPKVYMIHKNTDTQAVKSILIQFNSKRISKTPATHLEPWTDKEQAEAAERERMREQMLRKGDDAPHGILMEIAEKKKKKAEEEASRRGENG